MTATDWVQAIAMVLLVVATIFYAYQANKARDSAEASAQASKKMAEETKKQRYSESLPLLVPDITPRWDTRGLKPKEVPYDYLQTGVGMKVTWRNLGNGVAINSGFSFWTAPTSTGKATFFPPRELGT